VSERLAVEGKMVGPHGFVVASPVARRGQAVGDGVTRYVPTPRVREGAAGFHHTISVNSSFDDSESQRERDPERAMSAAADALRTMRGDDKKWHNIGLTFVFLLAGETKDGTRVEERSDGGLYRVPTSLRAGPNSNLDALLNKAARGVMAKINAGFGGGIESRFYGVSQWRLLRVDISAVPVKGGRGVGKARLLEAELPLAEILRGAPYNSLVYSPSVSGGCFRFCLATALYMAGKRRRSGRDPPPCSLQAVKLPPALCRDDHDGDEVPCDGDVLGAWGKANSCTINAFRPATEDETNETGLLLLPLCLVTRQPGLPERHVDLLYFDDHWSLVLNFGRAYRGLSPRVKRYYCRHCLSTLNRHRKHICGEDSTTMALQPAARDATYKARGTTFAGRLPLPMVATLDMWPENDDEEDGPGEIGFELDVATHPAMAVHGGHGRHNHAPLLRGDLFRDTAGTRTSKLLQNLHGLGSASMDGGRLQRFSQRKRDGDMRWHGGPCEACGRELTADTAVHHHEHVWGHFVAWVCADCNKAEGTRAVTVVTRGLKGVMRRLLCAYNCLSAMRIRIQGSWKDPIALYLSWQEGDQRRRPAVRLLCLEKLSDSADGQLLGGTAPLKDNVTWLLRTLWSGLRIDPCRFSTLPQVAEAACLAGRPGEGPSRVTPPALMLPHTPAQMTLCSNRAGGLVYAQPGVYRSTPATSITEFDITKCFGALLQEKVAVGLSSTARPIPRGADWRAQEYADTWIAASVWIEKDSEGAAVLRDLHLPERVQQGLPVPRGVLLALEECGAYIEPVEMWRVTYRKTHSALMGDLLEMHRQAKAAGDGEAARLAKTMMVSAYGKLAQNDTAWPEQQLIHSARDARLSLRHTTPSLRLELVREASNEVIEDVWEVEPNLEHYPHAHLTDRRHSRRLCLEELRSRLADGAGLHVLRVFHDSYLVVAGARGEIDRCLSHHGLGTMSYTVSQRFDAGLEIMTLAGRRAKQARRPVYAGQDIAMRSWEKIYRLLAAACRRFGARNVTVIRVMVDCLTLRVRHRPGEDVAAELKATGATGDGVTPGSWKNEYEGEEISEWFQLNKTGYEVRYCSTDGSAGPRVRRRLGGLPKADRDTLPHHAFTILLEERDSLLVQTSKGPVRLKPPALA
jgi:hypothetical protein